MALFSVLFDIAAKTTSFESSMASIEKKFDGLAETAKRVGEVIGVSFAADKLFGALDQALDRAEAMNRLAQSSGVATEALSKLSFAAEQNGVSQEQLGHGLKGLNVSIIDAIAGTGRSAEAFKALGISIRDASGNIKGVDAVLGEIAQRFSESADGPAKAALAQELFKKGGEALIPVLNAGKQGLRDYADAAEKAGLVISGDTAKAASELHDQLTVLQKTLGEGLANAVLRELMPAMRDLTQSFTDNSKGASGLEVVAYDIADALKVVANIALAVGSTMKALAGNYNEIADIIVAITHGKFSEVSKIRDQFERDSAAAEKLYQDRIKALWQKGGDDILEEVKVTAKRMGDALNFDPSGGAAARRAIDNAIKMMEDLQRAKKAELNLTINQGEAVLQEALTEEAAAKRRADFSVKAMDSDQKARQSELALTIKNNDLILNDVLEKNKDMQQIAESAARGMQGAFQTFFYDPMKDGFRGLLLDFINVVRQMAAEAAARSVMKSLFGDGAGQSGTDFFSSILKYLSGGSSATTASNAAIADQFAPRAAGGPVWPGSTFLVGESGPELFTPASSGSITPNNKLGGGGVVYAPQISVDSRADRAATRQDIQRAVAQGQRDLVKILIRNNPQLRI